MSIGSSALFFELVEDTLVRNGPRFAVVVVGVDGAVLRIREVEQLIVLGPGLTIGDGEAVQYAL